MSRRWRRLLVLFAGGIVLALAVLVAGAWWLWLPRHRPPLQAGETYGIDVSHHQIDWPRVRGDDMSFAYIKATEGAGVVDPEFHANWTGSRQAGVKHGAYHFFTLCASGQEQAVNQRTGQPVIVYAGSDFVHRYRVVLPEGTRAWWRQLLRRPDNNYWRIWQASDSARVTGVHGRVDLDVMRP